MVTSHHQYTTMVGLDCLLVLFAAFQVITSQEEQGPPLGPPLGPQPGWGRHKCSGPPPGIDSPQNCCKLKPIFTEEEMESCGFQKINEESKRSGPPKPPDCSKHECLLKAKGCLNEDKSANLKAIAKYLLEEWAEEEWKPAVEAAMNFCLSEKGVPGPPQFCEANRVMFCVGGVMFTECPKWEDSDDCKRLKEHMDECSAANFPPPN